MQTDSSEIEYVINLRAEPVQSDSIVSVLNPISELCGKEYYINLDLPVQ